MIYSYMVNGREFYSASDLESVIAYRRDVEQATLNNGGRMIRPAMAWSKTSVFEDRANVRWHGHIKERAPLTHEQILDRLMADGEPADGICAACGDLKWSDVEPDAMGYDCDHCFSEGTVSGSENFLY